jgi:DNA-binding MarR family transcriptional regulator
LDGTTLEALDGALCALFRGRRGALLHGAACRAAGVELDPPAFFVLTLLGEEPARLTELAPRLGLDASTVSRKLHGLEAAGLTTREEDPADGRAALVGLSDEGRRVVDRVHEARLAYLAELLEEWSERDGAELSRLLVRFAEELARRGSLERAVS